MCLYLINTQFECVGVNILNRDLIKEVSSSLSKHTHTQKLDSYASAD